MTENLDSWLRKKMLSDLEAGVDAHPQLIRGTGQGGASPPESMHDEEDRLRREWSLGDYDNGDTGCQNCGRSRVCLCPNGKHRCEKCSWSPELGDYAPDLDF